MVTVSHVKMNDLIESLERDGTSLALSWLLGGLQNDRFLQTNIERRSTAIQDHRIIANEPLLADDAIEQSLRGPSSSFGNLGMAVDIGNGRQREASTENRLGTMPIQDGADVQVSDSKASTSSTKRKALPEEKIGSMIDYQPDHKRARAPRKNNDSVWQAHFEELKKYCKV